MTASRETGTWSRRTALTGLGSAAAGAALATSVRGAVAQKAEAPSLAGHPLTGVWLVNANPPRPDSPQAANVASFRADGTVLNTSPVSELGPIGVQFMSHASGIWTPDTDRRGHFTAVQIMSDAEGTFLGTFTIDGFPEVSEDGLTFIDTGDLVVLTIRDSAGAIVEQYSGRGGRPVTALRMVFGAPNFPPPYVPEEAEATPTS